MNLTTPGLPVDHQIPGFTQTHDHWVSDAIRPSHPLLSPSPALNLSQHQDLFKWVNDRMISLHFQGAPFNIMVIQVYAPTSNTEEAEVEQFYEDLQDLLELTFLYSVLISPRRLSSLLLSKLAARTPWCLHSQTHGCSLGELAPPASSPWHTRCFLALDFQDPTLPTLLTSVAACSSFPGS